MFGLAIYFLQQGWRDWNQELEITALHLSYTAMGVQCLGAVINLVLKAYCWCSGRNQLTVVEDLSTNQHITTQPIENNESYLSRETCNVDNSELRTSPRALLGLLSEAN